MDNTPIKDNDIQEETQQKCLQARSTKSFLSMRKSTGFSIESSQTLHKKQKKYQKNKYFECKRQIESKSVGSVEQLQSMFQNIKLTDPYLTEKLTCYYERILTNQKNERQKEEKDELFRNEERIIRALLGHKEIQCDLIQGEAGELNEEFDDNLQIQIQEPD